MGVFSNENATARQFQNTQQQGECSKLSTMAFSFFDRMKQAVTRTRESLAGSLASVVALTREVDDASLDDLEFALLAADIGADTTSAIMASLRERALRKG